MGRRTRIFIVAIAVVLAGATLLFLTVNNSLVSPYFIHRQKEALRQACSELLKESKNQSSDIEYLEEQKGIVVVSVPNDGDINKINERLKEAFLAKGLGISKYWLWQEDYVNTVRNGTQQRIYEQGNLGYRLLIQYFIKDDQLMAAAAVIPNLSRPLAIANTVSAFLMGGTSLLLLLLVWWMGSSLEKAQRKISNKNEQMKHLLHNVSHDLKTPIALIKAYTSGMRDGMDDGSFLDTIAAQNDRMEQMTLRLLELSRYEDGNVELWEVELSSLLMKALDLQMPLFRERDLQVESRIAQGLTLECNEEMLATIFDNLLANALKYAAASPVTISLQPVGSHILLELKNAADLPEDTDTDLLWEPFGVAERSRNSNLRGSGLGLSLVRAAAQAIDAGCSCQIKNGMFRVSVLFRNKK